MSMPKDQDASTQNATSSYNRTKDASAMTKHYGFDCDFVIVHECTPAADTPDPGGPYSRIPLGGFTPIVLNS